MKEIKKAEIELDEICKWLAFYRQNGLDAYTDESLQVDFQPHHFIHRRSKAFRWDMDNIFAINKATHFLVHSGGEGIFGAKMREKYPLRIQKLIDEKRRVHRFRRADFWVIYDGLYEYFESIFGDYDTFKKLSLQEKYQKAFEVLNGRHT